MSILNSFKSKWSKWVDITVGSEVGTKYLLQARRHKNGRIQFKVRKSKLIFNADTPTLQQIEEIEYNEKTD